MIILYHKTGWIQLKKEYILKEMPLRAYRKWVKLFAQWGAVEQHKDFSAYIKKCYQEAYEMLNVALSQHNDKAIKKTQKIMQNYNKKYEILMGCLP